MEIKKKKIILDTDNGDDIDDLFTIYLMLNSPQFEVVGIVCSYLNTPLRARQIKHVLKLAHREDIPVFAGCGEPIRGYHDRPTSTIFWQYEDILMKDEYKPNSEDAKGLEAIDFMIESARKYQGELYICEIAPECTLGRAIRKDKEAFKNTKIYIMGGAFFEKASEWNIDCDFDAARIVFESGLNITYVGHNVTIKMLMDDTMYQKFNSYRSDDYTNYLISATALWKSFSKRNPMCHDPLTLLTIIYDDLCEFETKEFALVEKLEGRFSTFVPIEMKDEYKVTDKFQKVRVAKTVDVNNAFAKMRDILKIDF